MINISFNSCDEALSFLRQATVEFPQLFPSLMPSSLATAIPKAAYRAENEEAALREVFQERNGFRFAFSPAASVAFCEAFPDQGEPTPFLILKAWKEQGLTWQASAGRQLVPFDGETSLESATPKPTEKTVDESF